uniref:Plant methyltransferase dimerisation domain-containing protein n=1 Tax=Aegilops tauschii subsp. strangulata TaxID=200361 RepID=A0A453IWR1_AEGTS
MTQSIASKRAHHVFSMQLVASRDVLPKNNKCMVFIYIGALAQAVNKHTTPPSEIYNTMAAQAPTMAVPTDTQLIQAQAGLWRHSLCHLTAIALRCAVQLGIPTAIHRLGVTSCLILSLHCPSHHLRRHTLAMSCGCWPHQAP